MSRGRGRILVVDDEEAARTTLGQILTEDGFEVRLAADGEGALRLVAAELPDIVLTDLRMPGLDGHAVISALRVANPKVPIIAISGGGSIAKDELLLKAAQLGAVEVIMKPFGFEQLKGAVGRALSP